MTEKYEKHGESVFETHQLMEMLLFSFVSRTDTNPTAHAILESFPGCGIFSESAAELTKTDGVGTATANGLKISADTVRRLMCDQLENAGLDTDFRRRTYVYLRFLGKSAESMGILYLSKKNRVMDFSYFPEMISDPEALAKEIKKTAEGCGAKELILCHSHGDGDASPSVEDLYITEYLGKKLAGCGICITDHFIVTGTDCVPCTEKR